MLDPALHGSRMMPRPQTRRTRRRSVHRIGADTSRKPPAHSQPRLAVLAGHEAPTQPAAQSTPRAVPKRSAISAPAPITAGRGAESGGRARRKIPRRCSARPRHRWTHPTHQHHRRASSKPSDGREADRIVPAPGRVQRDHRWTRFSHRLNPIVHTRGVTDQRVPKEDGARNKLYECELCGRQLERPAPPFCPNPDHPDEPMVEKKTGSG